MKNLYHKVAVASVCTALGFVLGANEEVKAATFTLTPTIQFGATASMYQMGVYEDVRLIPGDEYVSYGPGSITTRLAEFNISNFFLAPNTIIRSAIFQDKISSFQGGRPGTLGIFGYLGNGTAEASDLLGDEVLLTSIDISSSSPGDTLSFDVTPFVNQRVSNGDTFAGFAISLLNVGGVALGGTDALGRSSLVIETVDAAEPVPEPTAIFGSALALGLGGWLKRKKSNQQHKTTPMRLIYGLTRV
ncbi:PEP-CTERM sorting domain-containing protein [Microcoleus sp. Pol10_D6]